MGSTNVPKPKKPDIGQDISQYIAGYGKALPSVLKLESRPKNIAMLYCIKI